MKAILPIVFIVAVLLAGCGKEASPAGTTEFNMDPNATYKEIAKIKLMASGEIFLNGESITQEDLEDEVVKLRKEGGAIWLFRDPSNQPPTRAQLATYAFIMNSKLPLKLVVEDFK